jgi:hypothetical protein
MQLSAIETAEKIDAPTVFHRRSKYIAAAKETRVQTCRLKTEQISFRSPKSEVLRWKLQLQALAISYDPSDLGQPGPANRVGGV